MIDPNEKPNGDQVVVGHVTPLPGAPLVAVRQVEKPERKPYRDSWLTVRVRSLVSWAADLETATPEEESERRALAHRLWEGLRGLRERLAQEGKPVVPPSEMPDGLAEIHDLIFPLPIPFQPTPVGPWQVGNAPHDGTYILAVIEGYPSLFSWRKGGDSDHTGWYENHGDNCISDAEPEKWAAVNFVGIAKAEARLPDSYCVGCGSYHAPGHIDCPAHNLDAEKTCENCEFITVVDAGIRDAPEIGVKVVQAVCVHCPRLPKADAWRPIEKDGGK